MSLSNFPRNEAFLGRLFLMPASVRPPLGNLFLGCSIVVCMFVGGLLFSFAFAQQSNDPLKCTNNTLFLVSGTGVCPDTETLSFICSYQPCPTNCEPGAEFNLSKVINGATCTYRVVQQADCCTTVP